jgi:hypothetical protein
MKSKQAPRPAASRESSLVPFLEKYALPISLCLVLIGAIRVPLAYSRLGLTSDEPGHFACGLEYLSQHVYRYEPQHPPLARAMGALLPYLSGARPTGNPDRENEGTGQIIHSADPDRFVALMRLGVLPFFVLGSLVVFLWARHSLGGAVAVLATLLYTLLPEVLAHSGVATTDMGITACLGAAFLCLILWAESPTWQRAVLLGLSAAAAVLTKFTALGYLPITAAFALAAWWMATKPSREQVAGLVKSRAPTFALAAVTGAAAIWCAYFFSFAPFFEGIQEAFKHNAGGHISYLLGKVSGKGFWYYFPVALSVKTPLAFLILVIAGLWIACTRRTRLEYLLPVAFAAGILIPGMTSHVNIGVRHILPIYLGLSITAATGLLWLIRRAKPVALLLMAWMAVSSAIAHPDYLAYFNELGMSDPEQILVDSDLEWGQSTKPLAKRLKQLGATSVNFGVRNGRSDYMQVWPGLPHIIPIHPGIPAEGWTAISPTVDRTSQYGLYYRYPNVQPWFDTMEPRERIGPLRLYYIAPGTLRR